MDNYIEINGKPQKVDDLMEWAKWFETADRVVRKTEVGDAQISTVFLGIDHSFVGGLPVLYETMIFGGEHNGYQCRYTTRELAADHHDRVVQDLTDGVEPSDM